MYEYNYQIYQYLQTHLPIIEQKLDSIVSAVGSYLPFVGLIVVLALVDHVIKKGDLM